MATEYQKKNRKKEKIKTNCKNFQNVLSSTIQTELSMHMIVGLSVVTIGLGIFLSFTYFEWVFLIFILGCMFGMELFNTALENLVDLETSRYQVLAKASKDTASAAEGIFSFLGILGMILLFVPKIITYIGG